MHLGLFFFLKLFSMTFVIHFMCVVIVCDIFWDHELQLNGKTCFNLKKKLVKNLFSRSKHKKKPKSIIIFSCYLCHRDFDLDCDWVRSFVSMASADLVLVDFSMQPMLVAQPPVELLHHDEEKQMKWHAFRFLEIIWTNLYRHAKDKMNSLDVTDRRVLTLKRINQEDRRNTYKYSIRIAWAARDTYFFFRFN